MYDCSTGLYYAKARYYDASVGRFISEDSYRGDISNSITLNLYTYGNNNLARYTDPSGNFIVEMTAGTVFLIIAAGTLISATYVYLNSPQGQRAIREGAVVIHNNRVIAGKTVSKVAKVMAAGIVVGGIWIWKKATSLLGYKAKTDKGSTGVNGGGVQEYRLPSWNKVKIDMNHIISGHTAGGGRGDNNKDKFPPGMKEAAIAKAIQEAYKNAEKVSSLQYPWQNGIEVAKQKFQESWGGNIIEFWFNYTTNKNETAYPKW